MAVETWLFRHDEIQTGRPFGCDVDEDEWLWEGSRPNRLYGHNLRTAECDLIPVPEMGGEAHLPGHGLAGQACAHPGRQPLLPDL